MYAFKLQIGCMIAVIYIMYIYIKEIRAKDVPTSRVFNIILTVSPIAILFDGVTAWTVNHRDIVPDWMNLLFHYLFFIFMDMLVLSMYVYVIYEILGIREKLMLCILQIPGMLTVVGLTFHMPKVYYIEGKTTAYSYGLPVFIGYGSLVLHIILITVFIIKRKNYIERHRRIRLEVAVIIVFILLLIQTIWPESLISAIMPLLAVTGIYLSFEDPALKRINRFNKDMVTSFATLVESRDNSTGGHIKRTGEYVTIILNEMKKSELYAKNLTADYINSVIMAAPMHDIGKIAIPDSILQKPGSLSLEEYETMKEHAKLGGEIVKETLPNLGYEEYQKITYEVARYHHEKWNGKGYPDGLKEEEIPLHARVMAIADVFDAVSADRCYRPALPLDECFKIIEEGSGVDFDPQLVSLFLKAKDEVVRVYQAQSN